MSIQITDLVNRIISNPAPVLFLDTCAILDIMNTSFCYHINSRVIETANKLLKATNCHPPLVWLVITEDVENEWKRNAENTKNNTHDQINELSKRLNRFDQVITFAGITPDFSYSKPKQFLLDEYLYKLSEKLKLASCKIKNDEDCQIRALERVRNNHPPYSKQKKTEKGTLDCVIIEHFIKVSRILRERTFENYMFFVSTNTKDYLESDKPHNIKEPLKSQFSELKLQYITDIAKTGLNL
ncbi:MAG: DUF4935 domain-containing protein [Calditrichaeota bacterium]|nr:DUF4935 domain-containing protein [Calditrichota bacterium]